MSTLKVGKADMAESESDIFCYPFVSSFLNYGSIILKWAFPNATLSSCILDVSTIFFYGAMNGKVKNFKIIDLCAHNIFYRSRSLGSVFRAEGRGRSWTAKRRKANRKSFLILERLENWEKGSLTHNFILKKFLVPRSSFIVLVVWRMT